MRFSALAFAAALACATLYSPIGHAFWSNTGVEVRASFEHTMILDGFQPSEADAHWEAEQLSWYIAGPLQRSKPIAGPKHDNKIDILSIQPGANQTWNVRFRYTGTFIVEGSRVNSLKIVIPYNHSKLYNQAKVGGRTPCTDAYFSSEKYFWYFWSPDRSGCRLQEGVHYAVVIPQIQALPQSTPPTFPEYSRLRNAQGEINVLIAFGADKDENGLKPVVAGDNGGDPNERISRNKDHNAPNYIAIREKLIRAGFRGRVIRMDELGAECGKNLPFGQSLIELQRQDAGGVVKVRLFWGVTSEGQQSLPYYCLLNKSMSEGSVFIYNGHSNLGSSAYLPALRDRYGLPFAMNTNQYQLLAFLGCSSYGYFNFDFFKEKMTSSDPTGMRNLDVITNGVASYFQSLTPMTWSILQALTDYTAAGKTTSYQDIINRMKTPFLTSVNGDEDNR